MDVGAVAGAGAGAGAAGLGAPKEKPVGCVLGVVVPEAVVLEVPSSQEAMKGREREQSGRVKFRLRLGKAQQG